MVQREWDDWIGLIALHDRSNGRHVQNQQALDQQDVLDETQHDKDRIVSRQKCRYVQEVCEEKNRRRGPYLRVDVELIANVPQPEGADEKHRAQDELIVDERHRCNVKCGLVA